jgi:uncharacterized protein (DUF1330 family)
MAADRLPETAMTVYVINNMSIHDRAEYEIYVRGFMDVFRKFAGQVLAVKDAPSPLEGAWPHDRTILLSFPSREELARWYESPDYQAIVGHRFKGTTSNVVVLDALP